MDHFVPRAKEVNRYYDQKLFLHDGLKAQLESLLAKVSILSFSLLIFVLLSFVWHSLSVYGFPLQFDASLARLEESPVGQFRDAEDILNKSRKDSLSWHGKICHCLDDLGLICASEVSSQCFYPSVFHLYLGLLSSKWVNNGAQLHSEKSKWRI